MLRNENHFAFERFSLNLCKLQSLNMRIIIFLSVLRVLELRRQNMQKTLTGKRADKSFRTMPL